MGGGIISLVANGAQDVYLTGSPQITYFKVIYRRYTNFAMETIEHAIDSAKPGGRYSVQVQRNGDLATKTAFRVRVPAVRSEVLGSSTEKIAWVRRLGHALIKEVEVKIGGMRIDHHVGVWLDIFYELTHTQSEERGYRALIGDVEEMTALRGKELFDTTSEVLLPEYTLYIPFQFWFCRNYGLALPLIALQYHEVRIDLQLEEVGKLMCWTGKAAPNMSNFSFKDAGIMIDYVYLESGERRKYAQLGHEYLIEQVQFSGEETVQINSNSASNNQKFKLNYNHPTKELVWALKVGAFNGEGNKSAFSGGRGKFLCYTHDDAAWTTTAVDYAAQNLAEGCIFINPKLPGKTAQINGQPAHLCSNLTNPGYNDGQRIVVELRNNNVTELANGKCLDEINETGIAVWCYDTLLSSVDFSLLGNNNGVELSDMIDFARVVVSHTDGAEKSISIEAVEVRHRFSLTDLSVPVEDFTVDNRSSDSNKYCVHKDVSVVQPNNYGLRLDGKGNPIQSANIQLNGHDRLKVQEGSYFNYYQTKNHHTRTPADGINVYSFALHPEKHQPSGTTNLSRIDSTILNLNFADGLRQNNRLKLNISTDTKLFIFAFSYNVLRVMSGMAGLAYSN
ncbi:capsid protein [Yasminevirus sp. GU-2018]|uniref:Capsid protein n=1 Tax=Yasminevirus sp. GU-2018 TaxID=2420051 RepID=A0A5K0U8J7_9VIRU|nr:capsid protein [Yasminevirus sp. GU-2018]